MSFEIFDRYISIDCERRNLHQQYQCHVGRGIQLLRWKEVRGKREGEGRKGKGLLLFEKKEEQTHKIFPSVPRFPLFCPTFLILQPLLNFIGSLHPSQRDSKRRSKKTKKKKQGETGFLGSKIIFWRKKKRKKERKKFFFWDSIHFIRIITNTIKERKNNLSKFFFLFLFFFFFFFFKKEREKTSNTHPAKLEGEVIINKKPSLSSSPLPLLPTPSSKKMWGEEKRKKEKGNKINQH